MINWKVGETYRMQCGRPATILAIHKRQTFSLIGERLERGGVWCPTTWTIEGRFHNSGYPSVYDLIPPDPKREKVVYTVNHSGTDYRTTLHLEDEKPVLVEFDGGKGADAAKERALYPRYRDQRYRDELYLKLPKKEKSY